MVWFDCAKHFSTSWTWSTAEHFSIDSRVSLYYLWFQLVHCVCEALESFRYFASLSYRYSLHLVVNSRTEWLTYGCLELCWLSTPHPNCTVILTSTLHATALMQWDNCDMLALSHVTECLLARPNFSTRSASPSPENCTWKLEASWLRRSVLVGVNYIISC